MGYVFLNGTLETQTRLSDAEAVRVETDTTIPANTSIDVTVKQDTNGDGTADNQESYALSGGQESFSLSSFQSVTDSEYWIEYTLASTDSSNSPSVNSTSTEGSITFQKTATVFLNTVQSVATAGQIRRARSTVSPVQVTASTNPEFRTANVWTADLLTESSRRLIIGATDTQGIVVPQDEGTGLAEGEADWMSAGHFAGMLGQQHNTDYVEDGLSVEPDWNAGTFDMEEGLAYFEYPEADVQVQGFNSDGKYNDDWVHGISFTTAVPAVNDLTFRENEITEVWLTIDQTEPNLISIEPVEEGSFAPDPPNLLIAKIDPVAQTVKDMNRGREVFPTVYEDPNDVQPGEVWFREDIGEFRAAISENVIVSFDTTEV